MIRGSRTYTRSACPLTSLFGMNRKVKSVPGLRKVLEAPCFKSVPKIQTILKNQRLTRMTFLLPPDDVLDDGSRWTRTNVKCTKSNTVFMSEFDSGQAHLPTELIHEFSLVSSNGHALQGTTGVRLQACRVYLSTSFNTPESTHLFIPRAWICCLRRA